MSQYSPILAFEGEYRFLSNFYTDTDGMSVEHFYQAAKSLVPEERAKVLAAATPGLAKRLGRKVELRADWENVKLVVMTGLVSNKFRPGSLLADMLLSTKFAYLCEGNNWHDNEWGSCTCYGCHLKPKKNYLGLILMSVRATLESTQWSSFDWRQD